MSASLEAPKVTSYSPLPTTSKHQRQDRRDIKSGHIAGDSRPLWKHPGQMAPPSLGPFLNGALAGRRRTARRFGSNARQRQMLRADEGRFVGCASPAFSRSMLVTRLETRLYEHATKQDCIACEAGSPERRRHIQKNRCAGCHGGGYAKNGGAYDRSKNRTCCAACL